ncbi:EAL domain-containing protein [Isoptericola sp. b441]|uniref:EAL domain-containing protein n=1 Tax=Actinotalea lenta TaxID=3064654 RepID=A0ABT9DC31_9CELL|nr:MULTISPECIES: EAL domain-containing protein [unclassified Isoptericola]MDO8106738.1 EAL domain-containing protein [Isoptericola sp. b441]MDO8121550.1 EAL domain-containing protein [Isoptericola sp. b490]
MTAAPGEPPTARWARARVTVLAGWCGTLLAVGAATAALHAVGGAPHPLAHVYYLPIIYAAARFGRRAGLATGALSGLCAGPLMPDIETGGAQPWGSWAIRLAFFALVGVATAWLARQPPRHLGTMLGDVLMGQQLRAAVRRHQIRLHLQPIVALADGRVTAVEALCRWQDRPGHEVPPTRFIGAAERTGAIGPLGREVLRLAGEQAARWAGGPQITVNVSAAQLSDPRFLDQLDAAIALAGARPDQLCVEITETAIVSDPGLALRAVRGVHDRGIQVALDDFGTGESSLTYLATFPIDVVKIDKSFVDTVDTDPTVTTLVRTIIDMAHGLGAATVAEGVERADQLAVLRTLGCTHVQGYHLGRPVPAQDLDLAPRCLGGLAAPAGHEH